MRRGYREQGWAAERFFVLNNRSLGKILNHRVGIFVAGIDGPVTLGEVQLLREVLPFDAETDLPDTCGTGLLSDELQQRPDYDNPWLT
jgi:hypothetical protein